MKKKLLSALLIGALSLGLTACGSSASSTPASGSAESNDLEKVTVVLDWTPNTNHTGFYVAQEKGYFKDAGFDVEIVQPPEDGAEVLVASGKAQFGISFQDNLADCFANDDPLPIQAVAALVQHNTSGIISRAGEGIDKPAGMQGKRYATWDRETEKAMIKDVVEKDGGDYSKVEMIPSTVTDEVSALTSNQIDAIWVFYGWAGIACELADLDTDYFAFKDIDPALDYYSPVLIANNAWLEENPDKAKAFVEAVGHGYLDAVENPEEAADILLKAAPELDPELVKASQAYLSEQYVADADQWGYMDAARWNGFYQWMNDNKLFEHEVPLDYGFTNDYLPAK